MVAMAVFEKQVKDLEAEVAEVMGVINAANGRSCQPSRGPGSPCPEQRDRLGGRLTPVPRAQPAQPKHPALKPGLRRANN